MTPQETDPDLPVSVQESLVGVWVCGGLLQGQGTECSSVCMGPFLKEVAIIFITSTILALGQSTGREHSPAHQQKIG